MATNPYLTPYKTERFSFIGSPQQRDGTATKDQRFVNLYPEKIDTAITGGKKYYLKKRPGVSNTAITMPTGNAQGVFYWSSNNSYYSAVNGELYVNSLPLITLSNTTNRVGIVEFQTDALFCLFVCDGNHAWIVFPSNVVTAITDANFPNPHIPSPIFLDGYIFLAKLGTQAIYNSNLADPTSWPTDGFIDAEMYPDSIVWLTKQQNYLVAVGTESVEFLYDNANPTGSPLQRNAPAVAQLGCPAPNTVTQTEKEFIMVGQTGTGGRTVWSFDGFTPNEVADAPVREALDLEGTQIINATAFLVQVSGHKWYVLNLILNARTFVYDFDEKMWHEWSSGGIAPGTQSIFNWRYSADGENGTPVLQSYNGGTLVNLDPSVYQDVGNTINCYAITSKVDFDTIERKRIYRLSLIGDAPTSGDTPILVAWSDDDYNTYTVDRPLQMNGSYPTTTQLGYMRRRAFRFTFQQNLPLRLESFELDTVQEIRR